MRLISAIRRCVLCFGLSVFALASGHQSESLPTLDRRELSARLNALVENDAVPGAVLFTEQRGRSLYLSAGVADKQTGEPMRAEAVMPNGSAGKKLTALLVAMLAEDGILSLDAPISAYLDKDQLANIEFAERMTLRQLLNHTSGIFEYNDAPDYAFFRAQFSHPEVKTDDHFPLSFALGQPGYFEPGQGHAYSNTGYALAGVILEAVLKHHPSVAIRKKILNPLKMTSSYFKGAEKHEPDMVSGYFINDEDPSFPAPMHRWIDTKDIIGSTGVSDAPLASDARGMARLLKAIVVPNPVVSDAVRQNMIGKTHLVASQGPRFYHNSSLHYGLGVWVEEIDGKRIYHHGGTEFGYFTQNIYIAEGDISITAMVNCGVNAECERAFQSFTFSILDMFLSPGKKRRPEGE